MSDEMLEQEHSWILFPAVATAPGAAYIAEWLAVAQFLHDHFVGTGTADALILLSMRGLQWLARKTIGNEKKTHQKTEQTEFEVPPAQSLSQRNLYLLAEMIYVRLVDQYLVYLADLLALAFREKPEMLRSSKQVSYETILQYTDMEDLRHALADRYVRDLSREGASALAKHFKDNLKLPLYLDAKDEALATQTIELRNIIVHYHGVIDEKFARQVPDFAVPVGQKVRIDLRMLIEAVEFWKRIVLSIDERTTQKLSLPTQSTSPLTEDTDIEVLAEMLIEIKAFDNGRGA